MEEDGDNYEISKEIMVVYAKANISNKIISKCSFLSPEISNFYNYKMIKSYLDHFWQVQTRALSCLNNILLTYPVQDLGDLSGLWKLVIDLSVQSFTANSDYHSYCSVKVANDLQNLTTSILYSILKKNSDIVIEPVQVSWLLERFQSEDELIRVNIVGTLGLLCKTSIGSIDLIVDSVTSLISKSLEDSSLWVITESLDIIFGVYDDLFNDMFMKYQFREKLPKIKIFLEKKMKEGLTEELLQDRVIEAIENIPQFLKYKKNQNK